MAVSSTSSTRHAESVAARRSAPPTPRPGPSPSTKPRHAGGPPPGSASPWRRRRAPGQTGGDPPLEHRVLFEVTFPAVGASEPPSPPPKRRPPARDRQVPDPLDSRVVHRPAGEPVERTRRARPGRTDLHLQLVEDADDHRQHPDQPQVQTDPHSVGSQPEPPDPRCVRHTEFSGLRPEHADPTSRLWAISEPRSL